MIAVYSCRAGSFLFYECLQHNPMHMYLLHNPLQSSKLLKGKSLLMNGVWPGLISFSALYPSAVYWFTVNLMKIAA